MKNIYVTYDEYGAISNIKDENMTFEQENNIIINPTFPERFYTVTITAELTEGSKSIEFSNPSSNKIDIGMKVVGEGIPEGTVIDDISILPPNELLLSEEATATGEFELKLIDSKVLGDYEARVYLRAQNGSSGFYEMVEGSLRIAKKSFTIPDEFMAEGTLRVGFEIKDGEKYIRFEPFKIEIRDFVRLSGDAGRFDYTVTVSVGEVTTLEAGESATVENVGTNKDVVLDIGIPRGWKGEKPYFRFSGGYLQYRTYDFETGTYSGWQDLIPMGDLSGLLTSDKTSFVGAINEIESSKVDKIAGKGLSTNDFTAAEKTKLAGIEPQANNYTHPAAHPADIITENANKRFVSDAEKEAWNAKADPYAAGENITIKDGVISAAGGGNIPYLSIDGQILYGTVFADVAGDEAILREDGGGDCLLSVSLSGEPFLKQA